MDVTRFDMADYLETPDDIADFLTALIEERDMASLNRALGTIARSRGMTKVSERSGLTRASLYKALSDGGNPYFSTVARVLDACGMHLEVRPNDRRELATA